VLARLKVTSDMHNGSSTALIYERQSYSKHFQRQAKAHRTARPSKHIVRVAQAHEIYSAVVVLRDNGTLACSLGVYSQYIVDQEQQNTQESNCVERSRVKQIRTTDECRSFIPDDALCNRDGATYLRNRVNFESAAQALKMSKCHEQSLHP
jgi:hypothetical protein